MKSYTDIEQSRKLAEILPIESADMVLLHEEPYETSDSKFDGLHQTLCVPFNKYGKSWRQKYKNISYFPCWSLAALLGILPNPSLHKTFTGWRCDSYNKEGTTCKLGESADNTVDACYKMILKLYELKML